MSETTKSAYWWNDKPVVPTFNRYFDNPEKPAEIEVDPSQIDSLLIRRHVEKMLRDGYHKESLFEKYVRKEKVQKAKADYFYKKNHWHETAQGVEAKLHEQHFFIRHYFESKVINLTKKYGEDRSHVFLLSTVKKALLRLDEVKKNHGVVEDIHNEFSTIYRGLYQHLPAFDKERVKSLGSEIASRLQEKFFTAMQNINIADVDDHTLRVIFLDMAHETSALRIRTPDYKALKNENKPFDKDRFLSSISHLIDDKWWTRKLWQLRNDWRENQYRATGFIQKKAHPYVSKDSLGAWEYQRKKNYEFFKDREIVDEDGNVVDMEKIVTGSISNPVIRRHELMTRMAGVEAVAVSRGDVGVFYTITCPSKYHATTHKGKANPKWNHSTPKQAQRYLCDLFARIGAKLARNGLRVYGFRVAEPHHDATPHWHLLLFMRKEDRQHITKIMRDYAITEDREELSNNTKVRFKAEKLDPKKGSATAYIAKYISKNIDGYALDGEVDHETGKPLKETAKLAMAWAARHRIRQYQPIGQPPITVWRELRKFAFTTESKQKQAGTFKRGMRLLSDPSMDDVLAAADVGCFATYIMKQGGVLIPRDQYTVRIAYQDRDKPNEYGEIGQKIFGIYSPRLGDESKVCTRTKTWTIRLKAAQPNDTEKNNLLKGGNAASWSSGNNSTPAQNLTKSKENDTPIDWENVTPEQHRAIYRRMRKKLHKPKRRKPDYKPPPLTLTEEKIREFARKISLCEISDIAIKSLMQGASVMIDDEMHYKRYIHLRNGNEIVMDEVIYPPANLQP